MNTELLTFALTTLTGFIAIMNPIATSTNFIGIVAGRSKESKLRIAKKSCIMAFIITVTFTLVGKWIFQLFGITIPAFKITGGILMFWIGFEMLMFQKSKIQSQTNNKGANDERATHPPTDTDDDDDDIATTPIAIPILAGPGTLVTAMNTVTDGTTIHTIIAIIVFAFMITVTYFSFLGADRIISKLGPNMIKVISKMMGLILAIIGTGMIITGIKLAFEMPL